LVNRCRERGCGGGEAYGRTCAIRAPTNRFWQDRLLVRMAISNATMRWLHGASAGTAPGIGAGRRLMVTVTGFDAAWALVLSAATVATTSQHRLVAVLPLSVDRPLTSVCYARRHRPSIADSRWRLHGERPFFS